MSSFLYLFIFLQETVGTNIENNGLTEAQCNIIGKNNSVHHNSVFFTLFYIT